MIKHTNRGKNQHRTAAIVACLFFCFLLGAFTIACQPGKAAVVLTPIPVEQTTSDEVDQNEVPIDTPASPELVSAENLWNPAKDLLNSASTLPGAIPVSVSRVSQPPEILSAGITVLVDADVVIPQTADYRIRECNQTGFTLDEYRKMLAYFFPNGKGKPNQEVKGVQADGTFDLNDLDLETGTPLYMQKGSEDFSLQLGGKNSIFCFWRTDEGSINEGYLVGDEELEQQFGELIRAPISLTREAALAQAQKVISDLDIQGWQIESIPRAVSYDRNHPSTILNRGWVFVYGLSDAGLAMHEGIGSSNSKNDRLSYWKANAGQLTIYVDERGVSSFRWEKRYQPSNVMYSNLSIISAEEALKLAKERIARIYGELDYENTQIEIYDIRLSTMLIGYSDHLTGQPFPDTYEDIALLIPTWNIAFRVIFPHGDTEYYVMPFSATDGGAISMLDF